MSTECKKWLQSECPSCWSILNKKGQMNLPKGLVEYISGGSKSESEAYRGYLKLIECKLSELIQLCGHSAVADAYRRDFSGFDRAEQLVEFLCEIALCASVGNMLGKLQLRPPTGKGTYSDFRCNLKEYEIYGESKRYKDPFPYIEKIHEPFNFKKPYSRSISQNPKGEKSPGSARPRSMDLRSKLKDAYRQFPEKTLNVLFIFHVSIGSDKDKKYIAQTLFGDANYSRSESEYSLENDGLFAKAEWRNVSACCLASINNINSEVVFPCIWRNPCASLRMPQPFFDLLQRRSKG